jgi:ribonuclease E
MPKQIIIAEQYRIAAVFAEDQIQELIVATGSHQVGDIYLGIVENVLQGIDAAFVNIGDAERNGFIHVTDLGPVKLKRSAGAITELLAPQQKVLIQIMKEPTGNKGPRLTGNISLPGRYLVLLPFGKGVNLSRRIRSENERNRLRALGILIKPAGMGLMLRTEAENIPEESIIEDLEALQKQWEIVQQQAVSTRAPALLGRDEDFIQRVLRDVYTADVNRIVVDSATGLKRVKQQLINWNANRVPQGVMIDHHREPAPILEYFRVNAAIREALKPRVDLPSGGYIVIQPTEALTVIDVNSGSFTRSSTARETVLWTNCEAATEIARQLRLRNLAGVIIVDFIDMDSRRDKLQVLEHFNKALKADKSRPQIAQLSELGLVELTRKRQGQNIYELFGRTCTTCGGLGHLVHLPGESAGSAGEMVERYLPTRIIDSIPSRGIHLPEARSDDFGLEGSEDADLDLSNHPSYQERGSNRRRRRRLRESPEKGAPRTVPTPSSAIPELPVLPEGNGHARNGDKPESPEWDRTRPSRQVISRTKSTEPPEVISVVMTAEEQQVYALMGISPLILFNGEVKNPRSAIVAVGLPGQSPVLPPPSSRSVLREPENREPEDKSPSDPDPSELTPTALSAAPAEKIPPAVQLPKVISVVEKVMPKKVTPEPEQSISAIVIPTEGIEAESEEGTGINRRRRRRSSATEVEQLSLETGAS